MAYAQPCRHPSSNTKMPSGLHGCHGSLTFQGTIQLETSAVILIDTGRQGDSLRRICAGFLSTNADY